MKTVWVVGLWREDGPWELMGIYTNKKVAVSACITDLYFVGPYPINMPDTEETRVWIDCYYPLRENDPSGQS